MREPLQCLGRGPPLLFLDYHRLGFRVRAYEVLDILGRHSQGIRGAHVSSFPLFAKRIDDGGLNRRRWAASLRVRSTLGRSFTA